MTTLQVSLFIYCFALAEIRILKSHPLRAAILPPHDNSGYGPVHKRGDLKDVLGSEPYILRQINGWANPSAHEFSEISQDSLDLTRSQRYEHYDETQYQHELSNRNAQPVDGPASFAKKSNDPGSAINHEPHIIPVLPEAGGQDIAADDYERRANLESIQPQTHSAHGPNIPYGRVRSYQEARRPPAVKNSRSHVGLEASSERSPNTLKIGFPPNTVDVLIDGFYLLRKGPAHRNMGQEKTQNQNPFDGKLSYEDGHRGSMKRVSGFKGQAHRRRVGARRNLTDQLGSGRKPSLYLLGGAMGR